MATTNSPEVTFPDTLRIISLNCWGLKYLSKHRHARLTEIGRRIAATTPPPDIVALQEVWTQQDYLAIHHLTATTLPHARFFHSGFFGSGLAILSAHPILESSITPYPLNGRPAAVWRGDWYVGKGLATARIRLLDPTTHLPIPGPSAVLEIFNTHLHAPYEPAPNDSYLVHRTAQAWHVARALRHAAERGHGVIACGDFNMLPGSLAHALITGHSPVRDVWREVWPDSAVGAAEDEVEKARGRKVPTVEECLRVHGATCDSRVNTWRWSKALQKDLDKGRSVVEVGMGEEDWRAKRLDYVFFASGERDAEGEWRVEEVKVGMTERHSELKCSLSDHFSIETTLRRVVGKKDEKASELIRHLDVQTYDEILDMTAKYVLRERKQRRWREQHFFASLAVSIGCLVAVWWSPHNYVAFILMLISTLNLTAGVLDGLMGFLFVKCELRALKEFEYDLRTTRDLAASKAGKNVKDRPYTGV